ncbi:MAG: DNA repair protein RadC [Bacilli bacterium]
MARIKDIPLLDRPRERLIEVGRENLSNEELISIILKTGTKNKNAKMISSELLINLGDIKNLNNISYNKLLEIEGIGPVKATELLACIELGKRINTKIISINNIKFTNPEIIYEYYKQTLGNKKQEHFYCIYLDNAKKIVKEKLLFIGTIDYSMVTPREVFKEAYLCDATGIICIHNHPSGNVLPSKEDINLTNKLIELGNLFNISIVDHIIISKTGYYSLYENGDIK